ncbi:MAG: sugar ABC transporter permease, partial [Clostridiales bacterium]
TLFLLVTQTINSVQVFTPVQVMTNGGPGYSTTTIVTYLYQKGFDEYKMGMASAIAVVMFVILLILSIIQNKVGSRQ